MSEKPYTLIVQPDHISPQLKECDNWVLWRHINKDGKWTKVPFQKNGKPASSTNPNTWTDFDAAYTAYNNGSGHDGIGFVVDGTDIVGVDIDHCVIDGEPSEFADQIAMTLDSYTEYSPSRTGIRIFVEGKKPEGACKKGDYEMYDTGRFLTVTGEVLTDKDISANQEGINAVHRKYISREVAEKVELDSSKMTTADKNLCKSITSSKQGEKFKALFKGKQEGYPSPSEARMAMLLILAFWTRKNSQQMDRIFRASKLYDKKWDSKRGDSTLGAFETGKAIATSSDETYQEKEKEVAADPFNLSGCISIRNAMTQEPPERQWVVKNYIPSKQVGLLISAGGVGKSNLAMLKLAHIAIGKGFGPLEIKESLKVLYLNVEDSADDAIRRFHALHQIYHFSESQMELLEENMLFYPGRGRIGSLAQYDESGHNVIPSKYYKWLDDTLEQIRPGVVVLDTHSRLCGISENSNEDVAAYLRLLEVLVEKYGCTIIILHHTPKITGEFASASHNSRGASALPDNTRFSLSLRELSKSEKKLLAASETPRDYFAVENTKANYSRKAETLYFKRENEGVPVYQSLMTMQRIKATEMIMEFIRNNDISVRDLKELPTKDFRKELKDEAGYTIEHFASRISQLLDEGILIEKQMTPEGGMGAPKKCLRIA